jgi:hypothetical protein
MGSTPVLDDQRQSAQVELLDEPEDRPVMAVEREPAHVGRLVGAAEAEVVGRHHPRGAGKPRDHLPVQERPGRLAVQAEDGIARTLVEVVHAKTVLVEVARREREAG